MTDVAHLELKVTSTGIDKATSGLRGLGVQATSTEGNLAKMARHAQSADERMAKLQGTLMGTFVGGAIVGGIMAIVHATSESEAVAAQLEARLKSTGNQVRMTKDELLGLANSLQGATIFDDEAIANAEAMLLTFTRIGREVFPKATEAVLNVATAMGTDLNSAALQVGKALNDPVRGINAMARAGIQFTQSQKDTIKALVETGRQVDAQKIILGELETQMGGAARAARNTLGGALKGVANDFANLMESDGSGLPDAVSAFQQLSATLKDPDVKQGFADVVTGVINITTAIAEAIPKIVAFNRELSIKAGLEDLPGQTGRRQGTMLDAFGGSAKIFKGSYEYGAGLLQGDAARRQSAINTSLQGREQLRASLHGTYQAEYPSNFGASNPNVPGSAIPDYLKAPVPGMGGPSFSAVPFSATTPLGGYPTKPGSTGELVSEEGDGPSKSAAKAAESAAKHRAEDLQNLRESLMTEEEAIQASYEKRERVIEATTQKGSTDQKTLHDRSAAMRDAELAEVRDAKAAEVEAIRDSLMTEEESIRDSYQRRLAIIEANMAPGDARAKLEAQLKADTDLKLQALADEEARKREFLMQVAMTDAEYRRAQMAQELAEQKAGMDEKLISVEEYERNKKAIEDRYAAQARAQKDMETADKIQQWGDMFGALGQLSGQFAQGEGKRAERAFKIAKALNIASVVMSTASAVMKANADPALVYPMNLVETVRITALGAAQLAAIGSQQYSGAYDKGGFIPGGKFGIVGEKGMELVHGPANVTGRSETKRLLEQAAANGNRVGSGGVTTAPAVVHISTTVTASSSTTDTSASDERDARELSSKIDNRVREVLQQEERQGGILWKRRNNGG